MHIFHRWKIVHRAEIPNGRAWFIHRRCSVCEYEEVFHKWKFLSTISDAIDIGIMEGCYLGIYEHFHGKLKGKR
jgi:hypothetical protein